MKKHTILFLLLLISITSCKKELDDMFNLHSWIKYTIKQGNHHSTRQVATFEGSELRFLAEFNGSAIYNLASATNQTDINKLYGFSDCNDGHHKNSARFGWNWDNKNYRLKIYAYCYNNGQFQHKFIKSIELNTQYEYKIKISDSQYIFTLDGETTYMPRGCSNKGGIKYNLFPYFGGNEAAPHDITIKIKELNN